MGIANYTELVTHVDHNIHVVQYGRHQNVAIECLTCMEILVDYDIHERDSEHEWGEVEYGYITGNPHRKCRVVGCSAITLDLDDDDAEEE